MSTCEWQEVLETALTGVFQDIQTVEVMYDGESRRRYPEIEPYVEAMTRMRLEELLVESKAGRMLIVKHVFDEVYAVVRFGDGACAVDLSKLIRIVFSQRTGDSHVHNNHYVSAQVVTMNIRRWKHCIALVFGERYASRLLATAMSSRDPGTMSMENLRDLRAFLTAVVGECLIFEPEKVDK